MAEVFELTEESPLGYFSKLTEFIYNPVYARYLRRIAARYPRDQMPEELDLMPFFIDALIFETYINGKTVLYLFIESHIQVLKGYQLRIYQGFKQYLFSCFQVQGHPSNDQVLLQDLLDDQQITITDSDARRFLFPGVFVVTRLLPFEDLFVPTGACAILNYKSAQEALLLTKLLKQAPLRIDNPS